MTSYMLDTNTVSHLIRYHPRVLARVQSLPMSALCISAITEAELRFGMARRPDAKRIHRAVTEFLKRVDVMPWDRDVANSYAPLRAGMEKRGLVLDALDLLIAAHAISIGVVMVTNDKAFVKVPGLTLEDWT